MAGSLQKIQKGEKKFFNGDDDVLGGCADPSSHPQVPALAYPPSTPLTLLFFSLRLGCLSNYPRPWRYICSLFDAIHHPTGQFALIEAPDWK